MVKHKRKKQRQRGMGWGSDNKTYSTRKVPALEEYHQSHFRKKFKCIAILAKGKPNKSRWFMRREGWFVWKRYEKLRDAENALKTLVRKQYPSEYYEFKIECS